MIFKTFCTIYYDMPIWEAGVAVGTLSAAYYAYAGIRESNKRLQIEQSPHVVFNDRIVTAAPLNTLHVISIKNAGKGRAINITATADSKGSISIIEGSNANSVTLRDGEHNTSWAIDEDQVLKGLNKEGRRLGSPIIESLPDEAELSENEKDMSDLILYLWYEDQIGNKYRTTGKFRHAGHFIKMMGNVVDRI